MGLYKFEFEFYNSGVSKPHGKARGFNGQLSGKRDGTAVTSSSPGARFRLCLVFSLSIQPWVLTESPTGLARFFLQARAHAKELRRLKTLMQAAIQQQQAHKAAPQQAKTMAKESGAKAPSANIGRADYRNW